MSAKSLDAKGAFPCPFCGADELHVETDSVPGAAYSVECDNPECNASGPCKKNFDEPVTAWNAAKRRE